MRNKTNSKDNNYRENKPQEETSLKKEIISWICVIVIAIVLGTFINTFILLNGTVPSGSMERTIMKGDRFFASKLSYLFDEPKRGDVVVFKDPDNETQLLVKRIIGLPNETVEIVDGKVYINGADEPLDEPYLFEDMIGDFGPYEIPEGRYFMLGDNRNNSSDARFWINKYVKKNKIVGQPVIRYSPTIDKIENSHTYE